VQRLSLRSVTHPVRALGAIKASIAQRFNWRTNNRPQGHTKSEHNERREDILCLAPGARARLADYDAIVVETSQALLRTPCECQEAARSDLPALSKYVQEVIVDAVISEGFYIVDRAAHGVLRMKLSITDLILKAKKPSLLSVPRGYWPKARATATGSLMQKWDVVQLGVEAHILDSRSDDLLVSLAALLGGPRDRRSFKKLDQDIEGFVLRLLCRTDEQSAPRHRNESNDWTFARFTEL
jgi:hypothetical protein